MYLIVGLESDSQFQISMLQILKYIMGELKRTHPKGPE